MTTAELRSLECCCFHLCASCVHPRSPGEGEKERSGAKEVLMTAGLGVNTSFGQERMNDRGQQNKTEPSHSRDRGKATCGGGPLAHSLIASKANTKKEALTGEICPRFCLATNQLGRNQIKTGSRDTGMGEREHDGSGKTLGGQIKHHSRNQLNNVQRDNVLPLVCLLLSCCDDPISLFPFRCAPTSQSTVPYVTRALAFFLASASSASDACSPCL
ncbi:hypothetical protein LZ32DRAFT_121337 [Colletotrichum eremochloae]|nr:hypothetical protein LZ32DRAFT_121337 [Colletotrichum eremochloae]